MSQTSPDEAPAVAHLMMLRAEIDELDTSIVRAIAYRERKVAEIAALKARTGLPLRDAAREEEIIRDRRHEAECCGICPDRIEAVMRVLIGVGIR